MDKTRIIEMIRKNKPAIQPLPEIFQARAGKADLAAQFGEILRLVGAEIYYIESESLVPEFMSSHFRDASDFSDPGTWKNTMDGISNVEALDTIILKAQFGIAENGAVWMDESNFPERIIPFIGKHLVVKLYRNDLIGNVIEAYEKYDLAKTGFGVFISGPSKTADIEQVLVFGAHGPLKHTVLLIN